MVIRKAKPCDVSGIEKLLYQVLTVHHNDRPDIFKPNTKKYTYDELTKIISDEQTPVFVAVDENNTVLGHCFCVFIEHKNNNVLTDIKTLYIDDLCVDENIRGKHVGKKLYGFVLDFAKENGCYNITLNVWAKNISAIKFYESCGLTTQKIGMEKVL